MDRLEGSGPISSMNNSRATLRHEERAASGCNRNITSRNIDTIRRIVRRRDSSATVHNPRFELIDRGLRSRRAT